MPTHDYPTMSDGDIAKYTQSITRELHANISSELIRARLTSGDTVIHRYVEGFCIVRRPLTAAPYLWVMYVDPAERGTGAGTEMMRDIIKRYESDGARISLQCHESLQSFYARFGFRVVDHSDGQLEMHRGD